MQRRAGRASTMGAGLATGALMQMAVILLGAAVLAKLVESEVMEERNIGYGIMILLIMAAFIGAMISFQKIKRQRLVVCLASGGICFAILLCITALFFGGQYRGVGVSALLIACGSILAVLPGLSEKRGGKRIKIKIPNG